MVSLLFSLSVAGRLGCSCFPATSNRQESARKLVQKMNLNDTENELSLCWQTTGVVEPGEGAARGRGQLQSVLPDSDGVRNYRYALDAVARARTPLRIQKVQRAATRRAENVACASVETPERPRSSWNRDAVKSNRRTRAF